MCARIGVDGFLITDARAGTDAAERETKKKKMEKKAFRILLSHVGVYKRV